MIVTVRTARTPYESDVREDMDVCGWLNLNPDVKAALDGVLAEYLRDASARPVYPPDVIRASSIVASEAGGLCKAANAVFDYGGDAIDRVRMYEAANRAAAAAIRFAAEIGNLKGRE